MRLKLIIHLVKCVEKFFRLSSSFPWNFTNDPFKVVDDMQRKTTITEDSKSVLYFYGYDFNASLVVP